MPYKAIISVAIGLLLGLLTVILLPWLVLIALVRLVDLWSSLVGSPEPEAVRCDGGEEAHQRVELSIDRYLEELTSDRSADA